MDGTEDFRQQMQQAIVGATMPPAVRNRKLVVWVVRQALLCGLAWYFWDHTWMRWIFWIGVVVALINLGMIIWMPRFLAAQQRKGNKALDRLDALDRTEEIEDDVQG